MNRTSILTGLAGLTFTLLGCQSTEPAPQPTPGTTFATLTSTLDC